MLMTPKKKKNQTDFLFFHSQVIIDRHPVRFFVHKRPHVDYFLEIVSILFFF